jgi:hypothetical protein
MTKGIWQLRIMKNTMSCTKQNQLEQVKKIYNLGMTWQKKGNEAMQKTGEMKSFIRRVLW